MTATPGPQNHHDINVCPRADCRLYIYGGLTGLAWHLAHHPEPRR